MFSFFIFFGETAIDSIASTLFCHTSFYLFVSCKLYLQVIKARFVCKFIYIGIFFGYK